MFLQRNNSYQKWARAALFLLMLFTSCAFTNEQKLLDAAGNGNLSKVKILVENGTNINAVDGWSGTPMMYAAASGHTEIVSYLLDKGVNINARYRLGTTAVMCAAQLGHLETTKFLVERGADLSIRETYESKTALDLAKEYNRTAVVEYLTKISKQ